MHEFYQADIVPTIAVDCGTLTDPSNGQVNHTTGTTLGKTATYMCDRGYNLRGDHTRTCQANGMAGGWSGRAPICIGEYIEAKLYYPLILEE